jgi:DNA-binding NarL/FixJ family response regulator
MPVNDRVLVVDDHERWREQIQSILEDEHWQIVGEAADGHEAIEKSAALAPDIILLDIELPTLNGLEAARQILAQNPAARIVFLSAHQSWDIAAAAMGTGAVGYLLKPHAGSELLPAMAAVARGKRFISAALTGHAADAAARSACAHEAGFYADGAALLEHFVGFAEAALAAGRALIVLTDHSRLHPLRERLQARGVDVERAVSEGRYVLRDPAHALAAIMVDGWPDDRRFWTACTALVAEASRASRGTSPLVAACAECSARLLRDGHADAAVRLESLWSELASTYNVQVLCGYPMDQFGGAEFRDALHRIRAEHSASHSE